MNIEQIQYLVPYLNPVTKCVSPDCNQHAVIHVMEVNKRTIAREYHLCEQHADDYEPFNTVGEQKDLATAALTGGVAPFDIRFIVLFDKHEGQGVYLREISGSRRFNLPVGIFEATSIVSALKRVAIPRPLTHAAIALTIDALGGKLEEVIVEELDHDQRYHAHLRIRQGTQLVSVDVRPSDAFALAVVCGVPVLVADRVLRETAGLGWNG